MTDPGNHKMDTELVKKLHARRRRLEQLRRERTRERYTRSISGVVGDGETSVPHFRTKGEEQDRMKRKNNSFVSTERGCQTVVAEPELRTTEAPVWANINAQREVAFLERATFLMVRSTGPQKMEIARIDINSSRIRATSSERTEHQPRGNSAYMARPVVPSGCNFPLVEETSLEEMACNTTRRSTVGNASTRPPPRPKLERSFDQWHRKYAYPNALPDASGNTGLHLVVYHGLLDLFIDLMSTNLDWKDDLERQNYFGETPLILAAERNRRDFLLILIKSGANPDGLEDERRTTALHRAVAHNHHKVVDALINQYGADPNAKGIDDLESPLELGEKMGDGDMRNLVRSWRMKNDFGVRVHRLAYCSRFESGDG